MALRLKGLPLEDVRQLNRRLDEIEKGKATQGKVTVIYQKPEPSPETGDLFFIHKQTIPSSEWEIEHKLGKYPSVTVVDSAGTVCYGRVQYVSLNKAIVSFYANNLPVAFSGEAYLN